MRRLFISYRTSDGKKDASRLAEDLMEVFGEAAVFFDKHDLHGGASWREQVTQALGERPVVLVLITPDYFGALAEGKRRIDQADDPVRLELVAAYGAQATLLPLLTEGMTMPRPAELPAELARLSETHALKLRTEDWRTDLRRLVKDLQALGLQPTPGGLQRMGLMSGLEGDGVVAGPPRYGLLIGAVALATVLGATGGNEHDRETVLGLAIISAASLWMAWRSHKGLRSQPATAPKVWSWVGLGWCVLMSLGLVSRGLEGTGADGTAAKSDPADPAAAPVATAAPAPLPAQTVLQQQQQDPAGAQDLTGAWVAHMANGTTLPFTVQQQGEAVSLTTTRLDVRNDPAFQALNQVLASTQGFQLTHIRVRGQGQRQGDTVELAMQMTDGDGQRLLDQGNMTLAVADGGQTLAGSVHFASGTPTTLRLARQ